MTTLPAGRDWVATSVWLAVATMLAALLGVELARRRARFEYASAPLWPRRDGSTRPQVRALAELGSTSATSRRSYGEVWDLDVEADRAA